MKRVLIVDDAIDLGRLLQDALKTVHPEIPISVVPSAEEALLESTRFKLDVLITDLRLPGMSGLDLISKIRARQPGIKVILMTGLRSDDRLFKQKDESSFDIFLRKPIMTPDFLAAVDQLLGESKPPAEEKPAQGSSQSQGAAAPASPVAAETDAAGLLRELAAVMPGEPVEAAPKPARLRATGFLKLPAEPQAQPVETGVSGVLSRLRASLNGLSAMLLDERGRPVAQAGDLPDMLVEEMFAPPLMASISAGAKISYLLGQAAVQTVHAYRGPTVDLVVSPVGQYVLLVMLQASRSQLRLALAFEEALNAQADLAAALEAMGLHVQSAMEVGAPEALMAEQDAGEEQVQAAALGNAETALTQDPGLEKFEELFKKKKTGELRMPDADSFWENVSSERKEVDTPGVLSFEQAQKLGLLPPEEEK